MDLPNLEYIFILSLYLQQIYIVCVCVCVCNETDFLHSIKTFNKWSDISFIFFGGEGLFFSERVDSYVQVWFLSLKC